MKLLTYSEKCSLFLKMIDKVDFFWNFQYISTGAIFMLLICNELEIKNIFVKIVISVIYSFFILFNLFAHIRAYVFLETLLYDIRQDADKAFYSTSVSMLLGKLSYKKNMNICIVVYLGILLLNNLLFWCYYK